MNAFDDWWESKEDLLNPYMKDDYRIVFDDALERAALEAESEMNEYADPSYDGACMNISIAIRALK